LKTKFKIFAKKCLLPCLVLGIGAVAGIKSLSADVLVGTEGNLNFLLGQPGLLYGWGAAVEFGFVPGKGGIKLSAAAETGKLGLADAKEANTTYDAYLISAMMKYNTPTRLPWKKTWALKTSYYLYSLNPWIGLGPAIQVNQAIVSPVSQNFDPSSDFLLEIGWGFNVSLGMFGIKDQDIRNFFVVLDMRYAFNLSSVERYNNQGQVLDSSKALFPTFENYFVLRLGLAYKL